MAGGLQSAGRGERRANIEALAWNTKVQHILATASGDGAFSVWDLRKPKPTMDGVSDTSGCGPSVSLSLLVVFLLHVLLAS